MLTRSRLRGVTLVEILIVMVIVATLAAVLYPSVAVQMRRGSSAALAGQLDNFRQAIVNYQQAVSKYPFRLTYLTTQPVAGDDDICGANLTNANRNAWRGPYVTQAINGDVQVGDVTIQNQLAYFLITGQLGMLRINVTGVSQNTATDLEQQFDGTVDFNNGTILWGVVGAGTLTFQIPIRGC
jgi:prepilin-type N-terminal cleavage/methylation domain-containing protein